MQTLTLGLSPAKVRREAEVTARIAVRLASLTAQLEAAVFERDLAQCAQARLAEAYRALAETPLTPPPDLIHELESMRRQRAQLEHEAYLLRQQCERLETDSAHWRAAHDRVIEERQLLLQHIASLGADSQTLHSYAVSLKQFLTVVQGSRRWRFTQVMTRLLGRQWK
jgi:chromosome segregation ATPase